MSPISKKILLVEDDELVGKAIASMCSKLGYHVAVKSSVAEARSALTEGSWDGYILDYNLPDGDGIELTNEIRARGDQAPVIFITGYATPEMALESQELGVVEVLAKPFKAADIHRALNLYLPLTSTQNIPTVQANQPTEQDGSGWARGMVVALLILLGLAISAAILYYL
ncbi:MAG: hypothetical protein OHK005_17870 [Candidatus Methylacidiphilales bacterium]